MPNLPAQRIERLLAGRPKQLCACCRNRIESGRLRQLSVQRARPYLTPEFSSVAIQPGGDICGLAGWTCLAWDSAQFGFPAARIEFLSAEGDYDSQLDGKRILLGRMLEGPGRAAYATSPPEWMQPTSPADAIQTFSLHLGAAPCAE